jgi:hypothetical protein
MGGGGPARLPDLDGVRTEGRVRGGALLAGRGLRPAERPRLVRRLDRHPGRQGLQGGRPRHDGRGEGKDFDYIWEEITLPLKYATDWERGRAILLEEVEEATRPFQEASAEALAQMARRYLVHESEMDPQTFLELTDNWIELTARFVIPVRSARTIKSEVSEKVLRRYSEEGIAIASATSEIVGFPPLRVEGLRELLRTHHRTGTPPRFLERRRTIRADPSGATCPLTEPAAPQ